MGIKVSTRDVYTTGDGREFFTLEAADNWERTTLVSKLEDHCREYLPESETDDWVLNKESLRDILILLRDNGITSKAKIQQLIEDITKGKA